MDSKQFRSLMLESWNWWNSRNAPRLGAALAYYALLSIAPLMILMVAICGLVFRHSAEQQVLERAQDYVGPGGAKTLEMLLGNAHHRGTGILATVIAFATLFFGASGVFLELRNSLNLIWDAPERASGGIRGSVRDRVGSFLMVLGLGVLLLISLVVSAALAVLQKFANEYMPLPAAVTGEVVDLASSVVLLTVLFALIYKFVPDVRIQWRDVGVGAVVTAVLFMLGKSLLALYLTTAAVGSTYGAAGSVVALVVWVYYSAQIFFFGAVFTRVFSRRYGSRHSDVKYPTKVRAQSAGG